MAYFTENSADQLIAAGLQSGDVVLISRRCESLPAPWAALCFASKFGISGSGRGCWDHAALVVRDEATDVPYLLEGTPRGVSLRSYEERLMQGRDISEVRVLPLIGARDSGALSAFLRDELRMANVADGFDADARSRAIGLAGSGKGRVGYGLVWSLAFYGNSIYKRGGRN